MAEKQTCIGNYKDVTTEKFLAKLLLLVAKMLLVASTTSEDYLVCCDDYIFSAVFC